MFNLLTFDWFISKAIVGLAVGYFLRMVEHWAWGTETGLVKNARQFLLYGVAVFAQSITVWLPVAYLFLLFIANSVPNETIITVAAYLIPLLTGFIAVDFRELVRRISKV